MTFGKKSKRINEVKPNIAKLISKKASVIDLSERRKIDEDIGREITKDKYESVENDMNKITKTSKSSQAQVFKLRRMLMEGNESSHPQSIVDPVTKEILVNKDEIKEVTLQFATGILQNNQPDGRNALNLEALRHCHNLRMNESNVFDCPDEELTFEDFQKEIELVKKKGEIFANVGGLIKFS